MIALPLLLGMTGICRPGHADPVELATYEDTADSFSIAVPSNWSSGEGSLSGNSGFAGASGSRRTLAWFPSDPEVVVRDTNITLTITNVGADFTKLGSFGSPFQFGTSMVNSMDRSYLLRAPEVFRRGEEIQIAKLIDAKEVNDMYFVEYTVKKQAEEQKHLLTTLALGFNGVYNRLYTVTAQCPEPELDKYRPIMEKVLLSFKPPGKV